MLFRFPYSKSGFTLIEILVVMTISALFLTVSIAGYSQFSRRQTLKSAYRQLNRGLYTAREFALSGRKPDACGTSPFYGTLFRLNPDTGNGKSFGIYALCGSYLTPNGNLKDDTAFGMISQTEITFDQSILLSTENFVSDLDVNAIDASGNILPDNQSVIQFTSVKQGTNLDFGKTKSFSVSLGEEKYIAKVFSDGQIQ